MSKNSLKRQNAFTLSIFLFWSVALFIVLSNGLNDFWTAISLRIGDLKAKDSLFLFLTPLLLGISCGVLPTSWKAILVFWRKHPLPGCRAFSQLAPFDPRIDVYKLEASIGTFPESPTEQNAKWYSLYKTVQNEVTVSEAHKAFLLYRDLTGISFLFLTVGTIALIPAGSSMQNTIIYVLICGFQYLVLAIVARNHGNRFVCNAMVEYLATK